jgi:ABC-2 type transport system ATP-binding protein
MKIFESKHAGKLIDRNMVIHDVSLSISNGERIAITGQNGSGKSSLLKLIGGIFEETEGEVKRSPIKTGYVPEHFPENINFKLEEYLLLMGKMSGKSHEVLKSKITKFAELFFITDFLTTPLKHCSKGTKQKAGIIQALLGEPNLLLLDEPLTGLDDQSQTELLWQLNSLKKDTTIIFTAHDSFLIDALAFRTLRVGEGKIISDSKNSKMEKVRYIVARFPTREVLSDVPSIRYELNGENSVEITVSAKESDRVLMILLERGCSILQLKEER